MDGLHPLEEDARRIPALGGLEFHQARVAQVARKELALQTPWGITPATDHFKCKRRHRSADLPRSLVAGLNTLDFYVEGNGITDGLTVVVTGFTADPIVCSADLNDDGSVDAADLSLLLANWGCASKCVGDVNADCGIDAADLSELLVAWGPCSN